MSALTFKNSLRAAAAAMEQDALARRYRNDPVLWAEEFLGLVLWSKQKEILRSIAENKRTAVKSCHSIGKTFLSAVASAWWISTREDAVVQSTAPTYNQVHGLLWEEIRKLHNEHGLRGRVTLGDTWLAPLVKNGRSGEIQVGEGRKPADNNLHGFHGTHRPDGVLVVLDEGCGIAQAIFTGAEAITTASFDRTLTVGNPDDPNTEFGDIFANKGELWNLITVSAFDTPNFTGEAEELRKKYRKDPAKAAQVERLLAGMPQPETVEQQKKLWGEESARYLSKVLAEFPPVGEDSFYSGLEIETARNNVIEPDSAAFRVLSVDVARSVDRDRTVIASNFGGHVEIVDTMQVRDLMEIAARVHKLAMELDVDQVRVDSIGVGGGVVDRLTQLAWTAVNKYLVVEMKANGRAPDPSIHSGERDYWYDTLKYQMRNGLVDLPDHPELIKELGMVHYAYPNGRLKIEKKDEIRKRTGKSPDFTDAVIMSCAPLNTMGEDPLSAFRPGDLIQLDIMADLEMTVSPF